MLWLLFKIIFFIQKKFDRVRGGDGCKSTSQWRISEAQKFGEAEKFGESG